MLQFYMIITNGCKEKGTTPQTRFRWGRAVYRLCVCREVGRLVSQRHSEMTFPLVLASRQPLAVTESGRLAGHSQEMGH